jgi:hypothetical protein
MRLAKKIAAGLLCGLIVGAVILGVGGRIVMSVIALMGHVTPTWSLGGTLNVIAFGAIVGAVSGLAYAAVRQYLPGPRVVKGLLAGLLLFGAMLLLRPSSARTAMSGFTTLTVPILLMFGVIELVYGVALAIVVEALIGRPETQNRKR